LASKNVIAYMMRERETKSLRERSNAQPGCHLEGKSMPNREGKSLKLSIDNNDMDYWTSEQGDEL
jgi:hypothetical protein